MLFRSCLIKGRKPAIQWLGVLAGILVTCQVGIGISMVHWALPLTLTDAHTGVAALLLATIVCLNWAVWAKPVSLATHQQRMGPAGQPATHSPLFPS